MGKIVFQGVTKSYHKSKVVIDDLSFTLDSGGFNFLVGQSGSGKTTILHLIHLSEVPNSGKIMIDDTIINRQTNLTNHRTKIGYVFQDYRLIEKQTATFNIKLPLYISKIKRRDRIKFFDKTVAKLSIEHLLDKTVESLSGGEKQLISIARAIVTNPKILLIDEPSAHLDRKNSLKILNVLMGIQSLGVTLILATHDIELIKASEGSRIMILKNGKIEFKKI
ncbi:MAG: ATP-binding cassette domain-containing protein [SAR324 cluster bacterium]|nr:ATP-binding cassette domain-containing protein [SAR324 cluster bacterium]